MNNFIAAQLTITPGHAVKEVNSGLSVELLCTGSQKSIQRSLIKHSGMKTISTGKILITLVAIWAAFGSYIFDWNRTHIYNPSWPPHAKFHNAQTMLLGTAIGLLSLWVLWSQKNDKIKPLRLATVLASLYWLTQAGSILFPGTALADPEFAHPGQLPAQLIVDVVMLAMLVAGYSLEANRLKKVWAEKINKVQTDN